MKQLVIFDLDGTLLNTIDDLGIATNYALEKTGFAPHELSAYPMFVGNGVTKLLERSLPLDARSDENIERLRGYFTEYYDTHNTVNTKPYPGIDDLLEELSSRGIKLAVASNKYQAAVTQLINHYFPGIDWVEVSGHRNGYSVKPDPSIVFNILLQCPTPKADVLYVGDSGVDMETARRACVESVGVTWGFRSYKELREYCAGHIVSKPEEILELAL